MTPITIKSNRLSVEIAQPGSIYRRTRFDWSGFITQVTLDGMHTFCAVEDPDPEKGSGGIGLCCEFGNEKAVGYDETAPGQVFSKPGVGLLVRAGEEPYNFFTTYEIAHPYEVQVETTPNSATFTTLPLECQGYAFKVERTIQVQDNQLSMRVQFDNVGSKAIHTHEYCHNFLSIDHHPTGPDYRLTFAYPVRFQDLTYLYRRMLRSWVRNLMPGFLLRAIVKRVVDPSVLAVDGNELTWHSTPVRPYFGRLEGFERSSGPQWELRHLPSGLRVSETDDFTPARVVVWGVGHVMSAEVYIDIDLEPGGSMNWTRQYQFDRDSLDAEEDDSRQA